MFSDIQFNTYMEHLKYNPLKYDMEVVSRLIYITYENIELTTTILSCANP